MKKLLTLMIAALISLGGYASTEKLGDNMSVNDMAAWKDIEQKIKRIKRKRPVVALVLGGGGAKGTAHVGVLKYLEELDMPIDLVVGTSMGALMGSMYSLGYTAAQMDSVVSDMDWNLMMSDNIPQDLMGYTDRIYKEKYALSIPFEIQHGHFRRSMPSAFIKGQNVGNLISSLTVGYQDNIKFGDLPIPFACVATDLIEGKGVVWTGGQLADALRSSMSMPVVFSPLRREGRFLVDGGMIDNFPADVAKALGADIIIGVSVQSPSIEYDEAWNVMDVVSLTIDLSGKTRLENTLKIPDVVIRPNLEGLTSLSFSEENVKSLIENGYKAACDSAMVLKQLKSRVGKAKMKRNAPVAKSLIWEDVTIRSMRFKGVSENEAKILEDELDIKPHEKINKAILDANVGRLYSTNSFKYVNYRLFGKGPEYDLVLDCEKGPRHRLGLGVRFDTEEMVSAMINIGLFAHSLYGSRINLDLRLSANPYVCLDYSFNLPRFPRFGLSIDYRYTNTNLISFAHSPLDIHYSMSRQKLYLTDVKWKKFNLMGGLMNTLARVTHSNVQDVIVGKIQVHSGVWINGKYDYIKGGQYFPESGLSLELGYSWNLNSEVEAARDFRNNNFHEIVGKFRTATSTDNRFFAFIFSGDLRILLARNHHNIPIYFRNILGSDMPGRYLSQQIAFSTISNAALADDAMLALRTDFRFQILKNNFITARAQLALFNEKVLGEYDISTPQAFINKHAYYGFGLEYGLKTVAGPIKIGAHWSSCERSNAKTGFGVMVSAGYSF